MRGKRLVPAVVAALLCVFAGSLVPRGGATGFGSAACRSGVADRIRGKVVCIHVGGKCVAAHNAKYRRHGYTCVMGRLRRYVAPPSPPSPPTPPTPPTPPAAPPPPATPGHYVGKTSQLEDMTLDVTPTGNGITGFEIHTVNESCSPGGSFYGSAGITGTIPIASNGTFSVNLTGPFTLSDGTVVNDTFTMHGSFSGTTATGSFKESDSFSYQGTPFSCNSGDQTFTVTRS